MKLSNAINACYANEYVTCAYLADNWLLVVVTRDNAGLHSWRSYVDPNLVEGQQVAEPLKRLEQVVGTYGSTSGKLNPL